MPFLEPEANALFFSTWTGTKRKSLGLAGLFLVFLATEPGGP